MRTASVQEIKQELSGLKTAELTMLCLRLARFKKENKELLTYLLFEAHDEEGYLVLVRQELDEQFDGMNLSHLYFVKKSLRKILRGIKKHIRYMGSKPAEAELLLYFCEKMRETGIPIEKNTVINNMFLNQLKKLFALVDSLHEDLQYEFRRRLDTLTNSK